MVIAAAILAGAAVAGTAASIYGSAQSAKQAKEQAKLTKEGSKEGAAFKLKQTLDQSRFDYRTTRERVNTELGATLGQADLQQRQAHEEITVAAAALDEKIGATQGISTLKQNEMARKARFAVSAARSAAIGSGFEYSGTSIDVVQQTATFARLEQLEADYESRVAVRGMSFDRAGNENRGNDEQ